MGESCESQLRAGVRISHVLELAPGASFRVAIILISGLCSELSQRQSSISALVN